MGVSIISVNKFNIIELIRIRVGTNDIFKSIVEIDEEFEPDELAITLIST